MLIVIEGCDGAGKSTLAERLTTTLRRVTPNRVELLHRGPIKEHPLVEYELALDDYRPGAERHVICDRWHLGEAIYGPLLRGTSQLTRADRLHIEMFLAGRGAVMILMTQPPHVIRRRIGQRGDWLIDDGHVDEIIARYHEVTYETNMPTAHAHGCEDEVIAEVIELALTHECYTADLNRFTTYVGPIRPHFLILGERRGERYGAGHSAAFVPYPATSGRFLLDALPDHIVGGSGLANALEEDVPALWETLGQPLILTLGQLAHRELLQLEMNHGAAPHPQFIRRFHNHHQRAYGWTMANAILHQEDMSTWRP